MAEAHSAVAFSFSVTPEGIDVNLNHEALRAVWQSGVRSWKKRYARMRNNFYNGVYPASPASWLLTVTVILSMVLARFDPSLGCIHFIQKHIPGLNSMEPPTDLYASCILFATLVWLTIAFTIRYTLKLLLTYQAWMYEPRGTMSLRTKLWLVGVKILKGRNPMLYSYQGSLPKLPVPSLNDTMRRYLRSVKPFMTEEKHLKMQKLVDEFKRGIGPKLQRYLILKSWWATNYVSDWWEEYVYLRGRSPIMVNSNFYGLDGVFHKPTHIQAARAANTVYSMLLFRRKIERNEVQPIMVNKCVPLCSSQYEKQFNTTRIPGIETDTQLHLKDSRHIVVYNRGRYYKVYIHYRGRLLKPCELEVMFQKILDDDDTVPAPGEEHLAALTAGDRIPWAKARQEYFCKGINKTSLDAIEKAAFVLSLDENEEDYDPNDSSKLDRFAAALLHGKGHDRWFDKSFTLVVLKNGRIGFNGEHSWADAPIMGHLWEDAISEDVLNLGADAPILAHLWEFCTATEFDIGESLTVTYREPCHLHIDTMHLHPDLDVKWLRGVLIGAASFKRERSVSDSPIEPVEDIQSSDKVDKDFQMKTIYRDDGHTKGEPEMPPPNPIKLQWDIPQQCQDVIENSLEVARSLCNDVDLHLVVHDAYGKGFMKKCKISPDAFIQMALQLAYFRDAGRFCLTYEASMTRYFREGRTETVRSCTVESSDFARSMDAKDKTNAERIELLRRAAEVHQDGYRNAMTGRGIDRHLFCLYVVSKYLGIESPFLKEVLSEPWRLSTSQTPHQQTDKLDLVGHPELISAGGGFGPVADDGYGVSYIIAGEDIVFFHISCKRSCSETDSHRFGRNICRALQDMKNLFASQ